MNPTQKQFSLTGVSLNKANAYQFAKQRAWKKSGDGMAWTVKRRERRAP